MLPSTAAPLLLQKPQVSLAVLVRQQGNDRARSQQRVPTNPPSCLKGCRQLRTLYHGRVYMPHVTCIIIYPSSKTDQLLACPLFRPKNPTKFWKGRKGLKDWSAIAISHDAPAKPRSPKAMPRSPAWCSQEACP